MEINLNLFDIQFFAEEKNEPATPKKRQKSRDEGQVAKSQDLSAATVIMAGMLAVLLFGPLIGGRITGLMKDLFRYLVSPEMDTSRWLVYPLSKIAVAFIVSWLPIGLICALMAFVTLLVQVGYHVSFKPFTPKLSRMNPVSGLKKIISMRSLVEMTKGVIKASLLLWMVYSALQKELDAMVAAMRFPLFVGFLDVINIIWWLGFKMALMLLILGIFDYMYQKWEFEKSIKMSKQEIKDEYKQMEGDPLIKRRIRQRMRELASKRMMSDVPKADVVVTNPTHLALAIKYDKEIMSAPVILAKGENLIAQKIKEVAAAHKIPIVENPTLARALFRDVEVGQEVPEALYRAVAEVLAFVYSLKK